MEKDLKDKKLVQDISLKDVNKLYEFLQGEKKEGLRTSYPKLSKNKAFSVIYYLQEIMPIIPDKFEKCCSCGDLFDADNECHYIGERHYCESCGEYK